jgi:hypothetical protein
MEWTGLSFVFGGDTQPNKWLVMYAKDVDFAIHDLTQPSTFTIQNQSAYSVEKLRFRDSRRTFSTLRKRKIFGYEGALKTVATSLRSLWCSHRYE